MNFGRLADLIKSDRFLLQVSAKLKTAKMMFFCSYLEEKINIKFNQHRGVFFYQTIFPLFLKLNSPLHPCLE